MTDSLGIAVGAAAAAVAVAVTAAVAAVAADPPVATGPPGIGPYCTGVSFQC